MISPENSPIRALFAVVMEAHLHGVSTRKVDGLVKAWALTPGLASPRSSGFGGSR